MKMVVQIMKIERYEPSDRQVWDDFIGHSRNGTFMQERKFLSYHPPERFKDLSLLFFNDHRKLVAVMPAAQQRNGEQEELISYPGASHGGIIVAKEFGCADAMAVVSLLIEFCRDKGLAAVEVRLVPRIYHSWPSDELDFALRFNGFSLCRTELATALPLKGLDGLQPALAESTQRNIRKAQRLGVEIDESKDLADFWDMLAANLKERHQARPTHTLEELTELSKRYPQSIKLFAANRQTEMVGGVLVFLLNNRVINCFYIAGKQEYQALRAQELLFYRVIQWGMERNYHYLDWGISTENMGMKLNSGLFRFKEKFGGRGVLREAYRLELSRGDECENTVY
jgi:hypothetical protein